jgi:hypothetical protein
VLQSKVAGSTAAESAAEIPSEHSEVNAGMRRRTATVNVIYGKAERLSK